MTLKSRFERLRKSNRFGKNSKMQAAIEYLNTYFWAIAILAVVIAVLYKLGVFSTLILEPRQVAGTCSVARPSGPFTITFLGLSGTCAGELPEFVPRFAGYNSVLTISKNIPFSQNAMTLTAWVERDVLTNNPKGPEQTIINVKSQIQRGFAVGVNGSGNGALGFTIDLSSASNFANQTFYSTAGQIKQPFIWYFVAYEYNGVAVSFWVNGTFVSSSAVTGNFPIPANGIASTYIGAGSPFSNYYWVGSLANIQLYNRSLSANGLYQLYVRGIGAPPINLVALEAWWPLNGDAVDYGGNGLSALPSNILYSSTWSATYVNP